MLEDYWIYYVATHVTTTHQRVKNAQQLVQEHLKQDQQKQKTWYDRKACEMKIEVGTKYYSYCWTGQSKEVHEEVAMSFQNQTKLGQVNYEVIIDSEGNTKVYQINLLKKWFSHTETVSSNAG